MTQTNQTAEKTVNQRTEEMRDEGAAWAARDAAGA